MAAPAANRLQTGAHRLQAGAALHSLSRDSLVRTQTTYAQIARTYPQCGGARQLRKAAGVVLAVACVRLWGLLLARGPADEAGALALAVALVMERVLALLRRTVVGGHDIGSQGEQWRLRGQERLHVRCPRDRGTCPFAPFRWHALNDGCRLDEQPYELSQVHLVAVLGQFVDQGRDVRAEHLLMEALQIQGLDRGFWHGGKFSLDGGDPAGNLAARIAERLLLLGRGLVDQIEVAVMVLQFALRRLQGPLQALARVFRARRGQHPVERVDVPGPALSALHLGEEGGIGHPPQDGKAAACRRPAIRIAAAIEGQRRAFAAVQGHRATTPRTPQDTDPLGRCAPNPATDVRRAPFAETHLHALEEFAVHQRRLTPRAAIALLLGRLVVVAGLAQSVIDLADVRRITQNLAHHVPKPHAAARGRGYARVGVHPARQVDGALTLVITLEQLPDNPGRLLVGHHLRPWPAAIRERRLPDTLIAERYRPVVLALFHGAQVRRPDGLGQIPDILFIHQRVDAEHHTRLLLTLLHTEETDAPAPQFLQALHGLVRAPAPTRRGEHEDGEHLALAAGVQHLRVALALDGVAPALHVRVPLICGDVEAAIRRHLQDGLALHLRGIVILL